MQRLRKSCRVCYNQRRCCGQAKRDEIVIEVELAFQLIAISGKHKGAFWTLDDSGLVLGRDGKCDIQVADPVVSRRHCRILLKVDRVHFEDLGSRNLALVNGIPTDAGFLKAGDEIAIGRERFLVSRTGPGKRSEAPEKAPDTVSWEKGQPIYLEVDSTKPATQTRPRTVQDLATLYEAAREFSSADSMGELLATLRQCLVERFKPLRLWIALVHNKDELTFCEHGEDGDVPAFSGAPPPVETMKKALQEGRGLIVPREKRKSGKKTTVFTLVSPVVLGRVNVAVLGLQTQAPHGTYDEEDLRFLVLLGQSLAPVICAVENVEQLRRDNERLMAWAGESVTLIGKSRAMRSVRSQLGKAAKSDLSVLITGETGTGKELVARMIHAQSPRQAKPLVVVNCAAIPRDLFESQLFGYEKGAFTGADQASVGLLAQAHCGTLFLDEIGDLSFDNQARILRAIENGTFHRVGAREETCVDIRVIAATNKDVPTAIKEGLFRNDLYHRLNGFEIHIPSLRERPSDVPVLAEHFFQLDKNRAKRPLAGIAPEAIEHLQSRHWSGNVRELRNCIRRAVSVARHEMIRLDDVISFSEASAAHVPEDEPLSLEEVEKRHIAAILRQCGGNVRDAAKALRIGRSTLYKKIADYNIE